MQGVFRKLCKDVFKLKQTQITALLDDSASRPAPRAFPYRHGRRSSHTLTGSAWALTDDVQDPSDLDSSLDSRRRPRRSLPLKRDAPRPLSPHLRCRSPLHTAPHLIPLNMPLYIATDSRHPLTDRNLAPFFHHFPCTFLLNDFSGAESAVNDKPIADLVEMVEGKWKSDWDGHG